MGCTLQPTRPTGRSIVSEDAGGEKHKLCRFRPCLASSGYTLVSLEHLIVIRSYGMVLLLLEDTIQLLERQHAGLENCLPRSVDVSHFARFMF